MRKIFSQEKISLEALHEILSILYETTIDKEDSSIFLVNNNVRVILSKNHDWIRFTAITPIPYTTPDELAAEFVNRLNKQYVIVKTTFLRKEKDCMGLFFDFDLICAPESELDATLLLKALKRYDAIVMKIVEKIRTADNDISRLSF